MNLHNSEQIMLSDILEKYDNFKMDNPNLKSYEYIDDFVRELTRKPIAETKYYCPKCDCYLTDIQVAKEEHTFLNNQITVLTHVLCRTKID